MLMSEIIWMRISQVIRLWNDIKFILNTLYIYIILFWIIIFGEEEN